MKIRFYLALILAKIYIIYTKIINDERNDKAGLLAFKVCPNFNSYIAKPKMVVMITGTNGKTTTTNLINSIFKLEGKKTVCNDWGANTIAGHAKCLIDGVNIFNKSIVDVAVLEADEMTTPKSVPPIKPNYLVISNISRDSIRRNASYYFIMNKVKQAIKKSPSTKLILNADDPISSFATDDEKRCIYYSINKDSDEITEYNANDFTICPKCYSKPKYVYQHYRHIGKVKCPNCDFKSKEGNYIVTNLDYKKGLMIIENNKNKEKYDFNIDSIFNAFNYLSVITLFRELGVSYDNLKGYIKQISIPKSRKAETVVNGIEIINQSAKGQNVSASSTVFKYLSTEKEEMEIILIIDEVYWHENSFETITWLYETDFEFLNVPNLKRIVVSSKRYKDYKLRLLLAGIPEEKIVCIDDELATTDYLQLKGTKKVYILYEIDTVTKSHQIKDKIVDKIKKEGIHYED